MFGKSQICIKGKAKILSLGNLFKSLPKILILGWKFCLFLWSVVRALNLVSSMFIFNFRSLDQASIHIILRFRAVSESIMSAFFVPIGDVVNTVRTRSFFSNMAVYGVHLQKEEERAKYRSLWNIWTRFEDLINFSVYFNKKISFSEDVVDP